MIILIAAMDQHRLIGANNKMPWHIQSELAHFRKKTSGHTVLMGRNTYESIGGPLPKRHNVVITSRPLADENIEVVHNLEAYLKAWPKEEVLFIIGGGKVYEATLPYADELIISVIKGTYTGDTYFPKLPHYFVLNTEEEHEEFLVCYYKRVSKKASQ